ncbi:MAG: nucleoside 2-deoxyribosyltransferase [Candidatus Aenigmatarchaeota archaeon]
MNKKTVYLANPLGFSEPGRYFLQEELIPEVEELGFDVINPFSNIPDDKVKKLGNISDIDERRDKLAELDREIGEMNRKSIQNCDLILAILEGSDVDSGTASEVGYAAGIGKKIIGYRSDFRLSSENLGTSVNLQVEYFVKENGGKIVTSLSELKKVLNKLK